MDGNIIVTPRWLNQLKTALYSSDDIGAVSCVTSNYSEDQNIGITSTDIDDMLTFAEEYNQSNPDKWIESFNLTSFCILFKRKIYDELSSLDESFGSKIFPEEDYSLRMRLSGYRLITCHDTFVYSRNDISLLREIPGENEQINREKYTKLLRQDYFKFCNKWNVSIKYNSIDSIVDYIIEKFKEHVRVLFIGSYSMQELFILHTKRPDIRLEYITDNAIDWQSQPSFIKQYNCTDILHEANNFLSGNYDFIVIDDGIMKYNDAINFIVS